MTKRSDGGATVSGGRPANLFEDLVGLFFGEDGFCTPPLLPAPPACDILLNTNLGGIMAVELQRASQWLTTDTVVCK